MLTIFHAPGSRSMRIVWLAEELGIPYKAKIVSIRAPTPEFLAVSPMRALPAVEDGGAAMIESLAIMMYLAEKHGPTPLTLKYDEPDFARYLQFLVFAEGSLGLEINPMIRTRFMAPDEHKQNWYVGEAEKRLCTGLDFVAKALGARDFIAGNRFTMADIVIGHATGVGKMLLGERVPANLLAYADKLQERAAYQRAAAVK